MLVKCRACLIQTGNARFRAAVIQNATWEGVTQTIESAGGLLICDSCPVESHMRISTCKEHGLKTPQCEAMVADSCKMARYVGDLIGCKTALRDREQCLQAAATGKLP